MIEPSNFNQVFTQINFSEEKLSGYEFDGCEFQNCSFANCNLSSIDFLDCQFEGCNLMLAQLTNTGLKDVRFKNCKLIGLDFSQCNDFLFQVEFETCQLEYAIFTKKKMKKQEAVCLPECPEEWAEWAA